jgi:hypothetical protein
MKVTRSGILTAIAMLILVAALPSAIRDTIETGRVYLFSWQFFKELPVRTDCKLRANNRFFRGLEGVSRNPR